MSNLSREEARTRASFLTPSHYRVDLDVTEAPAAEHFRVRSAITLEASRDAATFLDFQGEAVENVLLDGTQVDFKYDGARIALDIPAGQHEVTVEATGIYSHTGEGLHKFTDPEDSQTYLYTQFEPADARRVFPNLEQPDLKARFTISIAAPEEWTVLSNGAEQKAEELPANSQGTPCTRRHFATTKPMSTYLTAFIAGPYYRFTDTAKSGEQEIELGFYCRKALAPYFEFEDISTVTKQGLALLPEVFDFPYPWGKYDSVFVPEYNLGAMENPGCVTFSERAYIYRGGATRAQRAGRANTILHEMSHMWFGDLVTPVWWDDLWLKESFAEFMGAWTMVSATKYTEGWENFTGARVAWAIRNDQYPTTHPIVADVPDLEAADQVFDGITYAKGAAVLRQLVAWVGEEAFFAGARALFKRRQFASASLADLLEALAEASGRDVEAWAGQWLTTAGVSTIAAERGDRLMLRQIGTDPSGEPITRPHTLNVSGWKSDGQTLRKVGEIQVELTDIIEIPWQEVGGPNVDLILPNDGGLTYAKVALDERSLDAALAFEVGEPLAASVVSAALWEMVRDAKLPVADYLGFVTRSSGQPAALVASRVNNAVSAIARYTLPDERSATARAFCEVAEQARDAGADLHLIWTRALADAARFVPSADLPLGAILDAESDQDLRWRLLKAMAATGAVEREQLDAELANSGSAADVVAHLAATTSLPGTAAQTLEKLFAGGLSNDHVSALIEGLNQPANVVQTRRELGDYFGRIEEIWANYSQEIAERLVYGLYPMTDLGEGDPQAARTWLEQNPQAPRALRKVILDCNAEHERMLNVQRAAKAS